jgi:hypothetical protein
MRSVLLVFLGGLIFVSMACNADKDDQGKNTLHGPQFDCSVSTYTPVSKKVDANDKHCDVEWDIAKYPVSNDVEVGLLITRNHNNKPDKLKLTHSGNQNFHYDLEPHPSPGNDETSCVQSPFHGKPQNTSQSVYDLGPVQFNPDGPSECHYKFTFYEDYGAHTKIDPHIAVGK